MEGCTPKEAATAVQKILGEGGRLERIKKLNKGRAKNVMDALEERGFVSDWDGEDRGPGLDVLAAQLGEAIAELDPVASTGAVGTRAGGLPTRPGIALTGGDIGVLIAAMSKLLSRPGKDSSSCKPSGGDDCWKAGAHEGRAVAPSGHAVPVVLSNMLVAVLPGMLDYAESVRGGSPSVPR
eukprot:jgi/Mesvir1/29189/Mv14373-RA.1